MFHAHILCKNFRGLEKVKIRAECGYESLFASNILLMELAEFIKGLHNKLSVLSMRRSFCTSESQNHRMK